MEKTGGCWWGTPAPGAGGEARTSPANETLCVSISSIGIVNSAVLQSEAENTRFVRHRSHLGLAGGRCLLQRGAVCGDVLGGPAPAPAPAPALPPAALAGLPGAPAWLVRNFSSCKLQGSCRSPFPNCPICWDQTRLLINPCFIIPGFVGPGQPQLSFTTKSRWKQWDPGPCPGHGAQRCSGDALVPAPKEPSVLGTAGCMPRLPPALPLPTGTRCEHTDRGRFWGVWWPGAARPQALVQRSAWLVTAGAVGNCAGRGAQHIGVCSSRTKIISAVERT